MFLIYHLKLFVNQTSQVIDKKNTPFMSLDEIVRGLELSIEACTLYNEDINAVGGEIC